MGVHVQARRESGQAKPGRLERHAAASSGHADRSRYLVMAAYRAQCRNRRQPLSSAPAIAVDGGALSTATAHGERRQSSVAAEPVRARYSGGAGLAVLATGTDA